MRPNRVPILRYYLRYVQPTHLYSAQLSDCFVRVRLPGYESSQFLTGGPSSGNILVPLAAKAIGTRTEFEVWRSTITFSVRPATNSKSSSSSIHPKPRERHSFATS